MAHPCGRGTLQSLTSLTTASGRRRIISVGRARRECVARLLTCVTPHDNDSMKTGGKNVARSWALSADRSPEYGLNNEAAVRIFQITKRGHCDRDDGT